ncbi:MAG TPA: hypothetical protein VMR33_03415 [Candidatus Baltobacteraceae bacterium]|jgi:hypothetical protein|nr:hypothetical protein [Candidatus Baltobacteraceae bacterium]
MTGEFLKVLPKIAGQPLAIVAYICLAAGALLWGFRTSKSNDFLKALELIPQPERVVFCQKAGYGYDELSGLSKKDRFKRLTARDRVISIVVIVIAAALLGITSLREFHRENRVTASSPTQTIVNNGTIGGRVQNAIGNSNAQTINR